jgi:hypothetical protein
MGRWPAWRGGGHPRDRRHGWVGKTTFAVHAAHRPVRNFPDGQVFLPLHGHTPVQQPVDPRDAMASLLLTARVPAAQIPLGVEVRMAGTVAGLAGRQLLLVLDNAASSEQVLPRLPGTGRSLVLYLHQHYCRAGTADAAGRLRLNCWR